MPGDIGLGFKLADTLASWLLSPDGYAKWIDGRRRKGLVDDAVKALKRGDMDTVNDRLIALKRLQ
jgi:hypothetical protein